MDRISLIVGVRVLQAQLTFRMITRQSKIFSCRVVSASAFLSAAIHLRQLSEMTSEQVCSRSISKRLKRLSALNRQKRFSLKLQIVFGGVKVT